MRKILDPDDSYIVRKMFGCGHGHALPPGFTHWESGEACVWGHSGEPTDNASYHLYWRLVAVPLVDSSGVDMWTKICSNPDRWSQFPLAPEGLTEGARIGTKIKLKEGVALPAGVTGEVVYYKPTAEEVTPMRTYEVEVAERVIRTYTVQIPDNIEDEEDRKAAAEEQIAGNYLRVVDGATDIEEVLEIREAE